MSSKEEYGEVDMDHFDLIVSPEGYLRIALQMSDKVLYMRSAQPCALEVASRLESFDIEGEVRIRIPTSGWAVI